MQPRPFAVSATLYGAMISLALAAPLAHAASYTVSSLADSGSGSLRAVVAAASAGDSVTIAATGTLTLTSGEIPITKSLTIAGPGSAVLTISGNGTSRVFKVSATIAGAADAPVTISGVTLANGYAAGSCPAPTTGSGGALAATESLTLTDVVITDSYAARNGGGLAWAMRRNGQTLALGNVRLAGNSAGCANATAGGIGGGLFAGYDATVDSSAQGTVTLATVGLLGNSAQRHGGGVALAGPLAVSVASTRIVGNSAITGYGGGAYVVAPGASTVATPSAGFNASELSNNVAALAGGAIAAANLASTQQANARRSGVTLTNSTVSGNVVRGTAGDGAAVSLAGNVALTLNNCTVAHNEAAANASGAGIVRSLCSVSTEPLATLASTIVAMTSGGANGYADLSDGGLSFANAWSANQSLVRQTAVTLSGSANLTGVDPQLMALGWNGGSTRSHALVATSPALNAGSNPLGLAADQRGGVRVFGGTPDIGAYEATLTAAATGGCSFDLDGDGNLLAATDGLMLARILLGYAGDAVISGAINTLGTRPTWAAVRNHLNTNCGFSLP